MTFQLNWKKNIISPSIIEFSDIISHFVCKDFICTIATSSNALCYILAEFSWQKYQNEEMARLILHKILYIIGQISLIGIPIIHNKFPLILDAFTIQ